MPCTTEHCVSHSHPCFHTSAGQIWDTNDATLIAAENAVDSWEHCYRGLRGLLIGATRSAQSMYGTAKTVVTTTEHHLLLPVRDCILLPAFSLTETAVSATADFLQSDEASRLAGQGLDMVRGTPFVGESLLAPALVTSVDIMKAAWQVAQYPIPSKAAVRQSVDMAMTATKMALSHLGAEISFYAKLVDSNVTRTMTHTQWRVLGSGPYASLGMENKQAVLDHLCERYFSLSSEVQRYELAAHVKAQNRTLYSDLVLNGLLLSRANEEIRTTDTWLQVAVVGDGYDRGNSELFLLEDKSSVHKGEGGSREEIVPLWFHLPYVNGERPGKDAPWVRFTETDSRKLEERYRFELQQHQQHEESPRLAPAYSAPDLQMVESSASFLTSFEDHTGLDEHDYEDGLSVESAHPPLQEEDGSSDASTGNSEAALPSASRYPTIARWYEPNSTSDLLVDQRRHAVSFLPCCPTCGETYEDDVYHPPMATTHRASSYPLQSRNYICHRCTSLGVGEEEIHPSHPLPPLSIVMRPTMWRFHGSYSSEVRRGVWMLDTQRNGLQPYNDESSFVLEDAFLFLKNHLGQSISEKKDVLLTVQVTSPDGGETQLVQFRSLTRITAIQKTLGGALSLFNKKRVYRGARTIIDDYVTPSGAQSSERDGLFGHESTSLRDPVSHESIHLGDEPSSTDETAAKANSNYVDGPILELDTSFRPTTVKSAQDSAIAVAAPPEVERIRRASEMPGESDEEVEHLVLVVHGIGEMLRGVDLFGMALPQLSTIAACCDWLRKNHSSVHAAQFPDLQEVNPDTSFTRDEVARSALGRVEYLPIEWHEPFAIQTRRHESSEGDEPRCTTLKDVSLKTIPALRQFANDTMLDILYFMSPAHHDAIIDIVTSEANLVVHKFLSHTGIDPKKLKISILGHSLGSIISWDILSHQRSLHGSRAISPRSSDVEDRPEFISPRMDWIEGGPSTPEKKRLAQEPAYPQLNFEVSNFFMLGSPVAVFLMLRNQHRPLSDTFSLPGCKRVFNIFHPYDPVSYRIEPLLDPHNAEVEPKLISHWKGGFRVQYQTKFMLRKFLDETRRTQKNMIEAVEKGIMDIGLIDASTDGLVEDGEDDEDASSISSSDSKYQAVQCGNLNQGRRIDYMLQEKEIENANEYVFALSAHSSYWTQKDLSLFIARQLFRCRNNGASRDDGGFGKGITGQTSEKLGVRAEDTYIPDVLREDEAARATFQTL